MGWRTTTVRHGDTPQRLALRELGTAMLWPDIAALNNLVPPYFAESAGDGVISYGGDIFLPIHQQDSIATPYDPFLTDLSLDEDGFLSTNDGDLATVSGNDNLRQALSVRASASKRSLMFHPEFGCWAFTLIGQVERNSLAQLAAFYMRSAILEDPRVRSVEKMSAILLNDTISVSALVRPVVGEAIAFEKVF